MNIDGIIDFKQWRTQARQLLKQGIHPTNVNWSGQQQTQLEFTKSVEPETNTTKDHLLRVPAPFMRLLQSAACFRDEHRWALMYSLLWRYSHGEPHLLHFVNDPEVKQLRHMHQAVKRDVHKMHAFVRFKNQPVNTVDWYVSWFEPSHHIVAKTADFFVKRFTNMNWSILTPDACAHWDQQHLTLSSGIDRPKDIETTKDDMDTYWQQYYRHIFNPTRLKTQAMQSEMPKKYWDNLPEAALIKELISGSGKSTHDMLNSKTTDSDRLRNKSKRLKKQQDRLRKKHSQ